MLLLRCFVRQLRPKINNYEFTVEKGTGYDLNRSLFERLVLKGFPHQTLANQHRMRPEISALVRALTYPELLDHSSTIDRPSIRGVQSNVIFVNHEHPEIEEPHIGDRSDSGSTSSKQNVYEVEMVVKILLHLKRQGYENRNIVVLTPYLGQLSKLREALKNEGDPVLSDMDASDLKKAGILDPGSIKNPQQGVRLATIGEH